MWEVGIHFKLPFVERIARRVSLKEQVLDYPPQPVITKDNVTMQIDTVVYFQITDPKLYTYGVEQPMVAMETLTATTLRNIIGDLELDQTLTSRDVINTKMRAILDEATDPWGIKVNRVELKNILPPQDIQNSMEKQMKAERDRRQAILQAEGTKRSQILVAEGEKESAILRADAEKQSAILRAQGQAEAILAVQKATAEAMQMLNDACPNDQVIKLKALEDAKANSLQPIAKGDHRAAVAGSQDFVKSAPVSLVLVSDLSRFGNIADHTKLMAAVDAGIVCQNINIFCAATGLATVPLPVHFLQLTGRERNIRSRCRTMNDNHVNLSHHILLSFRSVCNTDT